MGRICERNGGGRAVATRMPAMNSLGCDNGDRGPDETESDEMIARKRFVIKKNAEEETSGW